MDNRGSELLSPTAHSNTVSLGNLSTYPTYPQKRRKEKKVPKKRKRRKNYNNKERYIKKEKS